MARAGCSGARAMAPMTTATSTRPAGAAVATGSAWGAPWASGAERAAHATELKAIIEAWTRQRTKVEVMETLGRAGVPAGAVFDTSELLHDPFLTQRGTFATVQH